MYHTFEGFTYRNGQWHDIVLTTGQHYSYCDFTPFKGEATAENRTSLYLIPDELAGGDYDSSGICNRSNYRTFLKDFSSVPGVYALYGGYGTYAIAIRLDVAEEHEAIRDTLKGLANYPVIDDEDLSNLEVEWQDEAMPDIIKDVTNHLNLDDYDIEIDDEDYIRGLIQEGISTLNLHWYYENNSAYLEYKDVLPYVQDRVLIEHCKDLPILLPRTWVCEETQSMYERKLKGTPICPTTN